MTNDTEIETSERSLTVQRRFDAPRERVREAWTDPDQVDQWWGPDGFTTTIDEMESGSSWWSAPTAGRSRLWSVPPIT
ncbi:SRPBCC domain-containing protein [Halorarum salinum]|uniref:SRPBCC domain-containing protein n=1 Tax=Halorarum salinum TaxID=2743089 RepID=A0A7D5L863_9EURY|nr:SRPBCC domain-containing protein [Halobaculum salinum]QLG60254.1 SRPBCC domain-containing protein [Halobaculum salinum]